MVGIGVLIVFLFSAWLMFRRILPAIIALPLMAVAISFIEVIAGKLTFTDISTAVIADGAIRLVNPMIISMFGGMVSEIMQKGGVAESFVRKGAELSGDNPFIVSIIILFVIALLFTTIGGLGAVIMIGTIVLPILNSLGLKEYVSGAIILFGISLGGVINPNNWAFSTSVLGLKVDVVSSFSISLFFIVASGAILFLAFELWRSRLLKFRVKSVINFLIFIIIFSLICFLINYLLSYLPEGTMIFVFKVLTGLIALIACVSIIKDILKSEKKVRWYSYLIPVVPLVLILVFKLSFIPAFLIGFIYGVFATMRKGAVNSTTRAIIEGSQNVIPAVVLMIGIGMLLSSILGPTRTGPGKVWYETRVESTQTWPVLSDMKPLMKYIVPSTPLAYVLIFSLLGPFALYRGPLNIWGLGYGVGGVLLLTGVPAAAVMGILSSLGIIQGVSDPTNTQNVWVANEVRVDVNTLMWRTLPFTWLIAVFGLLVASIRFY